MQKIYFIIQCLIVSLVFFHETLFSQDIEITSEGEIRSFKINLPEEGLIHVNFYIMEAYNNVFSLRQGIM